MSAITQIKAVIHTSQRPNAGTDGFVYLGICGREFNLSTDEDDFRRNSHVEYILGNFSNVEQSTFNDPTKPQLDTTDADRYPAYIRFEPQGSAPDWDFDGVEVTITPGGAKFGRMGDEGEEHLWLGQSMGKYCYLKKL